MASSKITGRLSKYFPAGAAAAGSGWNPRAFVTAARPLQKDSVDIESAEKIAESAEAVKDGAKEVRQTCEFIKDTATDAAKSVSKMTKKVTEKVSETAENIKETTGGAVMKGAIGVVKKTAEAIKDEVVGK